MTEEESDDLDLSSLSDEELVEQMHDDLYDGLKEEIEEGTNILLERAGLPTRSSLMRWSRACGLSALIFATASFLCQRC